MVRENSGAHRGSKTKKKCRTSCINCFDSLESPHIQRAKRVCPSKKLKISDRKLGEHSLSNICSLQLLCPHPVSDTYFRNSSNTLSMLEGKGSKGRADQSDVAHVSSAGSFRTPLCLSTFQQSQWIHTGTYYEYRGKCC